MGTSKQIEKTYGTNLPIGNVQGFGKFGKIFIDMDTL